MVDCGRRIACIWLPRFALAIATSRDPMSTRTIQNLAALFRPGTRWQELLECAPTLEAAGILPGTPLKEAQARFPDAAFLPCDDATLASAAQTFEAVLDALDAFSPIVEAAPRDALGEGRAIAYVDVAGLGPLYGADYDLGRRLAAAATSAFDAAVSGMDHLPLSIAMERGGAERRGEVVSPASAGIGSNKFTAWVAAALAGQFDAQDRVLVVPPGEEATFLAPLPLETIPLPLRDRQALQRLGVGTLGALARLPANAVQHRYGATGRQALRLAQGLDDTPLRPRPPRPAARVELSFDWEETELDRLTFALKLLSDQLAARLATLSEAALTGEAEAEYEAEADPFSEESFAQPFPDEDPPGPGTLPVSSGKDLSAQQPHLLMASSPLRGEEGRGVRYAAEALRVTWRLAGGDTREVLLRLAEPASTSAAFMEHLRWHAEGLERLLASSPNDNCEKPTPNLRNELSTPPGGAQHLTPNTQSLPPTTQHPDLTYEPMEQRLAVLGISLEAAGIQVPGGTQLKLLASPLQIGGGGAIATLDPVQRARQARRAIARLQARWEGLTPPGAHPVWQPALTPSRLPEHAFKTLTPHIALQLDNLAPGPQGPGYTYKAGSSRLPTLAADAGDGGAPFRGLRTTSRVALAPGAPDPTRSFSSLSPFLPSPPFWLVDPPQPAPLLPSRRKGGRSILKLGRQEVRVVRHGGPWKLVDPTRLTAAEPLHRDYYQVEAEDGRAYLVFWDRVSDSWFLQGIYD